MLKSPRLNVRNAADILNIQRDLQKIKDSATKSSVAVDEKGREVLVTFHSTLGENETKKATQSAISWQNANLLLGSRNNDNIHRQSEKSSVKTARGAILLGKFKQSYEAVMVLFAGRANTSTVVHESAHWLKAIMESLCEMRDEAGNFIATDQLRGELDAINHLFFSPKQVTLYRGQSHTANLCGNAAGLKQWSLQ